MSDSRRDVVSTHYRDDAFRLCPVCMAMVELDHAEALEMDVPKEGVDFEVLDEGPGVVDVDFVTVREE